MKYIYFRLTVAEFETIVYNVVFKYFSRIGWIGEVLQNFNQDALMDKGFFNENLLLLFVNNTLPSNINNLVNIS